MTDPTSIPPGLLALAAATYRVDTSAITGHSRDRAAVQARHAVIWTLRAETDLTYVQIGRLFQLDHTTVIAAVRSCEAKAVADPRVALGLAALRGGAC